jgi:hypothetical protein
MFVTHTAGSGIDRTNDAAGMTGDETTHEEPPRPSVSPRVVSTQSLLHPNS